MIWGYGLVVPPGLTFSMPPDFYFILFYFGGGGAIEPIAMAVQLLVCCPALLTAAFNVCNYSLCQTLLAVRSVHFVSDGCFILFRV